MITALHSAFSECRAETVKDFYFVVMTKKPGEKPLSLLAGGKADK